MGARKEITSFGRNVLLFKWEITLQKCTNAAIFAHLSRERNHTSFYLVVRGRQSIFAREKLDWWTPFVVKATKPCNVMQSAKKLTNDWGNEPQPPPDSVFHFRDRPDWHWLESILFLAHSNGLGRLINVCLTYSKVFNQIMHGLVWSPLFLNVCLSTQVGGSCLENDWLPRGNMPLNH